MKKKLMLSLAMVLVLGVTLPMATVFAVNDLQTETLYIKIGPAPADMKGASGWLQRVGTVSAQVIGTDLVVTYTADTVDPLWSWEITETHLWVGCYDAGPPLSIPYPQTRNGNPKIGHFPWKGEHDPALTEVKYTIPLASFNNPPLDVVNVVILAQAVVRPLGGGPEETAWGDCTPLPGPPPRWAKSFSFTYTPSGGG